MIGIKKVSVTPVTPNTGDIIDSASTLDDKTTNTYSMRIIDEKTNGTVLYENANGTNGNITLYESADNFEYIEIYGHRTNVSIGTKVKYKSGNLITLSFSRYYNTNMYVYSLSFTITGTSLIRDNEGIMYIGDTGTPISVTSSSDIYIEKIIGY